MKYESPMKLTHGKPMLERGTKHGDVLWFMSHVNLEWEDDSVPIDDERRWENPWHRAQMQEFQINSFGRTWALQ